MFWIVHKLHIRETTRCISSLAHIQSGILPHIRRIDVSESAGFEAGEDRKFLLISALPRDQLSSFESSDAVRTSTLQLLLQL
jgi:hypothetical protein